MKAAVVVFPGSNCDLDAYYALQNVLNIPTDYLWHEQTDLSGYELIILPGGFSYGDYLRPGAIARFAKVMSALERFVADGGRVLGICNGFQILCEAGLLPGALVRNVGLKFVCKPVYLRVENSKSPFTKAYHQGQVLRIPIAHGEGCYVCDEETLQTLRAQNQVLFRYCAPDGSLLSEWNPNGSTDFIAGITNENFNVLGLMPHPERACEALLGSTDGLGRFESLKEG
ncbi:MAG: phosphoribosylformylglycinamidine synthase subunit PurQ [candidate division WOR-3 bacterium]